MWGSVEIVSPLLQGTDYTKKFSVIYVIVPLCRVQGMGEECAWSPIPIGVLLHEDSSSSILGGISGNSELGSQIRHF